MFGLYTMHNDIRHSGNTEDFYKTISRVMREVYMKQAVLQVWEEIFNVRVFQHTRRDRPPRPQGASGAAAAQQEMPVEHAMPPVHVHIPDTNSDINPFSLSHIPEAGSSHDMFVPDTRSDFLAEL